MAIIWILIHNPYHSVWRCSSISFFISSLLLAKFFLLLSSIGVFISSANSFSWMKEAIFEEIVMGIFFHFLRKWDIPDPLFSSSFFLSKSLQLMRNMKSPTIKEVKQWANEMFLKGDLKLINFEKCLMLIPHVNKLFRILETLNWMVRIMD